MEMIQSAISEPDRFENASPSCPFRKLNSLPDFFKVFEARLRILYFPYEYLRQHFDRPPLTSQGQLWPSGKARPSLPRFTDVWTTYWDSAEPDRQTYEK